MGRMILNIFGVDIDTKGGSVRKLSTAELV